MASHFTVLPLKNADFATPYQDPKCTHIYHQYTIRVKEKRDELVDYLKQNGIPIIIYYPLPLHLQKAFKYLGYKEDDFPNAERASKEVLSLPIYPELKYNEQKKIIKMIVNYFKYK